MELSEISAILGIDIEAAEPEQIATRAVDFCWEMADCYEEGSTESNAFKALAYAMHLYKGGRG